MSRSSATSPPGAASGTWCGVALVGLAVVTWAAVPTGLRFVSERIGDGQTVFARFAIAFVVLSPFMVWRLISEPATRKAARDLWPLLLLLGLCGVVLPQVAFTYTVRNLSSGVASFLGFSYPAFSMVLATLVLRERSLRSAFLSAALLLLGFTLLLSEHLVGTGSGPETPYFALAVGLCVPILWGSSSTLAKWLLSSRSAPPLLVAWIRIGFASFVLMPALLLEAPASGAGWGSLGFSGWVWLLVLGVGAVAIGLPAYMAGLERVSLSTTSAIESLTAPLAAVFAIVFIPGERLSLVQWIGGLLLVAAALAAVSGSQAPRTKSTVEESNRSGME